MCTKPLKGFQYGTTLNGKRNFIICSSNVDHVEIRKGKVYKFNVVRRHFDDAIIIREYVDIPCGHCIDCQLERSRIWANRCVLEAKQHENNCFITLTYDDDHLPLNDAVRSDTGEITKMMTLRKKDLQLFMKRFRKKVMDNYGVRIRFLACGEYG